MAHVSQLPCDGDGVCMLCKLTPSEAEKLTCKTCVTPWHASCLKTPPSTLASTLSWECPDCSIPSGEAHVATATMNGSQGDVLVAAIRAIEADSLLTEQQKAKKRQELLSGKAIIVDEDGEKNKNENDSDDLLKVLDGSINCSFCMQLPERPVTTPCGHNFCLKCFQKWVGQGKKSCAKCRSSIPLKMVNQPRINSALVVAIRMAKISKSNPVGGPSKIYHFLHNQDRPDKAFTTERARKSGKANAASGKIFVTIPHDHFGPITAEYDPERNQGVLVGECWADRLECRQWGVHFPHVSGIAGQSEYGAQSVVLSGGYVDDEDHGEWFLYTGSGGRDLSGNKRTNKNQSFDQQFASYNKSLQLSCLKGYPVRVVRSYKEKRTAYAPTKGLRYDGVYRIEKCWRKVGVQGFKVCRYLFVRCDNEPAPWTSDEHGDRPRPLPTIPELKKAENIAERKSTPSWDYDEEDSSWKWKKPPPASKKGFVSKDPFDHRRSKKGNRKLQMLTVRERLLKEFSCSICRNVMSHPVTTPCAHNFCKSCLEGAFAGISFVRERSRGGRSLRSQKTVMSCPSCSTDISEFLQNVQVNTELKDVIESLKAKAEENEDNDKESSENGVSALSSGSDDAGIIEETCSKGKASPKRKGNPEGRKVDAEKDLVDKNGEEENMVVDGAEALGGDSEVSKAIKKRKLGNKAVAAGSPWKKGGAKTRGNNKFHEVSDEGNSSASSPMIVQSEVDVE